MARPPTAQKRQTGCPVMWNRATRCAPVIRQRWSGSRPRRPERRSLVRVDPSRRIREQGSRLFSHVRSRSDRGVMSSQCVCRLCGARLTQTFVDLGMSPLCESYVSSDALDQPEVFYPLHVRQCPSCLLVQLPAYVIGRGDLLRLRLLLFVLGFLGGPRQAVRRLDDRDARSDGRQPRHRGCEQRRVSASAFRGPGHSRPGRRAGEERGRDGAVPGHSDGGAVPRRDDRERDRRGYVVMPIWSSRTTCSHMSPTSGTSRRVSGLW